MGPVKKLTISSLSPGFKKDESKLQFCNSAKIGIYIQNVLAISSC